MDTPVSVRSRPAVPGAPRVYDMVISITFDVGSAKSNRYAVSYYEFIWCFQDERVHIVLPDCLNDAMLSLGPESLLPLTKGHLHRLRYRATQSSAATFSKKMPRLIQMLPHLSLIHI